MKPRRGKGWTGKGIEQEAKSRREEETEEQEQEQKQVQATHFSRPIFFSSKPNSEKKLNEPRQAILFVTLDIS